MLVAKLVLHYLINIVMVCAILVNCARFQYYQFILLN